MMQEGLYPRQLSTPCIFQLVELVDSNNTEWGVRTPISL